MSNIHMSYKYRLYPSKSQQVYLDQNFGCVRFVWNKLVANFNSWTPDHTPPKLSEIDLKRNPEFGWLNDAIAYALQQKRIDFEATKSQYFNKNRKVKLGKMQFKKKGSSQDSFRIPGSVLPKSINSFCTTGTIQLPKMQPMKVIIDRPFTGKICSVTISKNKCGQYFVSILVEREIELKQNTGRNIGIDLGIKDLCTFSDGTKIGNPKWFRNSQAKLKSAQQHLSRKTRGSNHYQRQKSKVTRLHNKIANQRKHFLHEVSTNLVNNYDVIVMEDLAVKNMVKNRKLAKSISDASWSSLVQMIKYKSEWYGRTFHQIDRFYPSSKTCSCCDHKMESMELNVRFWTCPSCGTEHDRDVNAAVNILRRGLVDLYGELSVEPPDYKHGDVSVRNVVESILTQCAPVASMKCEDLHLVKM